jgi:AraC-like DNA-binding protein
VRGETCQLKLDSFTTTLGSQRTLAEALLDADPSCGGGATPIRLDGTALARARQFLDAETTRVIRSSELEELTGLTRYDLARQFRSAFGSSPYRYSLMRRLDRARAHLRRNRSLADVALAAGFADQAHLSRMFKYAFGVTPARYRALEANRTP